MKPTILTRRPAESSAVAGAAALVIARLFGLTDPDVIVALAVLLGFVPGAVSRAVDLWRETLIKSP